MQNLQVNNSRVLTIKNAELSGYYFDMNLNIWRDFVRITPFLLPLLGRDPHR